MKILDIISLCQSKYIEDYPDPIGLRVRIIKKVSSYADDILELKGTIAIITGKSSFGSSVCFNFLAKNKFGKEIDFYLYPTEIEVIQ